MTEDASTIEERARMQEPELTPEARDCLMIWARVPVSEDDHIPRQVCLSIIIAGIHHRAFPDVPAAYFAAVSQALDELDGFDTFKRRLGQRLTDQPSDPPH